MACAQACTLLGSCARSDSMWHRQRKCNACSFIFGEPCTEETCRSCATWGNPAILEMRPVCVGICVTFGVPWWWGTEHTIRGDTDSRSCIGLLHDRQFIMLAVMGCCCGFTVVITLGHAATGMHIGSRLLGSISMAGVSPVTHPPVKHPSPIQMSGCLVVDLYRSALVATRAAIPVVIALHPTCRQNHVLLGTRTRVPRRMPCVHGHESTQLTGRFYQC